MAVNLKSLLQSQPYVNIDSKYALAAGRPLMGIDFICSHFKNLMLSLS